MFEIVLSRLLSFEEIAQALIYSSISNDHRHGARNLQALA
jgi:hypothetical protein